VDVYRAGSPKGACRKSTHGIGYGDVNNDGRIDVLESEGSWEQPPELGAERPRGHSIRWNLAGGGAQMYAYDVNGDGKTDVITSLAAHGYGLAWFEQTNKDSMQGWTKHMITGTKPGEGETGNNFFANPRD